MVEEIFQLEAGNAIVSEVFQQAAAARHLLGHAGTGTGFAHQSCYSIPSFSPNPQTVTPDQVTAQLHTQSENVYNAMIVTHSESHPT